MSMVFTVGVFDLFHYGHLELFRRAKKLGGEASKLIVGVQDQEYIQKYKANTITVYSTKIRCDLIESLRIVDKVIVYTDVEKIIKKIDFDIFAVGEDQNHKGFQNSIKWCNENGKTVVTLLRTPGISSTSLKQIIISTGGEYQ